MIDGHMHLEYGPLNEEYVLQFVKQAQLMGLDEIQILDHTHRFKEFEPAYLPLKEIPEQKIWLENRKMKFKDSLNDYIELMKRIQAMELPVKVRYGLEVCYTEESEDFLRELLSHYEFDFLVGAIHSIDGILYDMPFSKELLWDQYDVNHIYKRYYQLVLSCVDSGLFSQLAHPDTIKMFNYYPSYDLNDTYQLLSEKLKEKKMKGECNTGCHYRYNHQDIGLSDELLEIFKRNGVDIITASDAHHPKDVGMYIKQANERINK